jgi:hypothetical protein
MSFKKICTAKIDGRRWKVGFGFAGMTNGKPNDGQCNHETKRIVIQRAALGRKASLEEVVIHECAHAAFPQIEEDFIDRFAEAAAKVLAKMKAEEAGDCPTNRP